MLITKKHTLVSSFLKHKYSYLGNNKIRFFFKRFRISRHSRIINKTTSSLQYKKLTNLLKNKFSSNPGHARLKKLNKLKKLNNFQGLRFRLKLPLKSQRTKTNAKTRKKWGIF